jgi:hypothetical protein
MKTLIKSMSKKYPNDADLGKAVREMINMLRTDESEKRQVEEMALILFDKYKNCQAAALPSIKSESSIYLPALTRSAFTDAMLEFASSQQVSKEIVDLQKELINLLHSQITLVTGDEWKDAEKYAYSALALSQKITKIESELSALADDTTESKQQVSREKVIDLLVKERQRCKDIAYAYYDRFNEESKSSSNLGGETNKMLADKRKDKADICRIIGNNISNVTALTDKNETMKDRISAEYASALADTVGEDKQQVSREEMIIFARKMCTKQRHICQVEMDKDSVQDENGKWYVSCEDVLNASEPEELSALADTGGENKVTEKQKCDHPLHARMKAGQCGICGIFLSDL